MVLGVCADYEEQERIGERDGDWIEVDNFLTDAAAGMLAAPVTRSRGALSAPVAVSSPIEA